ncbi:unnamed protein product [Ectocarpus fasciculatus]
MRHAYVELKPTQESGVPTAKQTGPSCYSVPLQRESRLPPLRPCHKNIQKTATPPPARGDTKWRSMTHNFISFHHSLTVYLSSTAAVALRKAEGTHALTYFWARNNKRG